MVMKKVLSVLALVVVLSLWTNAQGSLQASIVIKNSSGTIVYTGARASLLWTENFVGKQIVPSGGLYPTVSPFSVPNHLNDASLSGIGELVSDSYYGTVLHNYVPDGNPEVHRMEFDLDIGSLTEYYMTLRYKLPADYTLTQNSPGYTGWHEIFDAVDEWASDNLMGFKIKLWMLEGGKMQLRGDHGIPQQNVWATPVIDYWPPLGEWFTLKVHLMRHPTVGRVTVWINDDLLFDVSGVMTAERSEYLVLTAKVYGGYMAHKAIYCAGIEMYTTYTG
jgi:hypothetical protein